ncbi:hypothetical protein [Corynebacterium falsenii]|uniref:hypothetical protein n=1 Tax=Corynebacterium falsenii TaxID=108486 RepID=UPI003FD14E85
MSESLGPQGADDGVGQPQVRKRCAGIRKLGWLLGRLAALVQLRWLESLGLLGLPSLLAPLGAGLVP